MEALMQVLESTMATRDPYTVGHQRRVSQIACSIGWEMGLSEDRLQNLRMAGTLHDLGKFAIPSGLLSKPGKLTPQEFALIKTHPQVAYNILEPVSLPGNTAQIILQHHERLNGSGYPQGLKGEEILLEARILGVADVMEAMCSHRPYRASLGLAETLDELTRNKGILYDGAVVETCLKLYGQDLPASRELSAGPAPRQVAMPLPLNLPGDGAWAHLTFARVRPLPQPVANKSHRWAKSFHQRHRAWMHLGSASILGWLIMTSLKGF
ncbi:MAG: HD-GYP domain-containing protein [Syntrophales bacterium]|nr:HD-GYP domain-containing protein [Syntrophales bacterium]